MNHRSVTLRAANATLEDGIAYARFANEASEGFMRRFLGRRFDEIIASAFLQRGHDSSYENVTFAECDCTIIGMIAAYTEARHRCSSLQPLRSAAGSLRLRMRMMELLLAPLMRLNDSIEAGDYYLQFIAVEQADRIGGVGSLLMDDYEKQAQARGSKRLSLDVAKSNKAARRFYEHRGWVTEWEWPKVWFMPALSVRMIKPI